MESSRLALAQFECPLVHVTSQQRYISCRSWICCVFVCVCVCACVCGLMFPNVSPRSMETDLKPNGIPSKISKLTLFRQANTFFALSFLIRSANWNIISGTLTERRSCLSTAWIPLNANDYAPESFTWIRRFSFLEDTTNRSKTKIKRLEREYNYVLHIRHRFAGDITRIDNIIRRQFQLAEQQNA